MSEEANTETSKSEVTSLVSELGCSIYTLQGWGCGNFTRTGKLSIWSIARFFENYVNDIPPLDDKFIHPSKSTGPLAVLSAQRSHITRALYQLSHLCLPVLCTWKFGYIGQKSFSLVFQLWDKETGAFLLQSEHQFIYIDQKTRKAVPLPQNVKTYKEQFPCHEFFIEVRTKPADPNKVYTATFKIVASDMDKRYHTTQSIYYRFALDAAYEAWKLGFIQGFLTDPCEYEVKSFQGKHVTETFAGEHIFVSLWEDDVSNLTLHFEINKVKDNVYVMYQKIVFYPLTNSKL